MFKIKSLKKLMAFSSLFLLFIFVAPKEAQAAKCSGNWEDWYCDNGCSKQGFDKCTDTQF